MDQAVNTTQYILIGINLLIGLVQLFGGKWMRDVDASQKENAKSIKALDDKMQHQEMALIDRLSGYVAKEEFREMRQEMRTGFTELFNRIDGLRDKIADKADRA